MKIIVESHIPFIRGVLETTGHEVTYLEPEKIDRGNVKDADALIIRTRTRCDASLLDGSRVSRIATATIGTDHIDTTYCAAKGISVSNAPGCNAPAVAQYVMATIASLRPQNRDLTIGIVGVGHVGSIVASWAEANGFKTILCDPPLGLPATLRNIAEQSDVITFHTPLDQTTYHMADSYFFTSCKRRPLIINAARGPITDTSSLISALESGLVSDAAIDCWEGEPHIDLKLLDLASVATPHIAGYSIQGKRRATAMAVAAIDPSIRLTIDPVSVGPSISEISSSYDPLADTASLRRHPERFEALRNDYKYRSEP